MSSSPMTFDVNLSQFFLKLHKTVGLLRVYSKDLYQGREIGLI